VLQVTACDVQIWSTIYQQLRVPDLPLDVSFTDWASCQQQVTLVMMRPVVSTAQSMAMNNNISKWVLCWSICWFFTSFIQVV